MVMILLTVVLTLPLFGGGGRDASGSGTQGGPITLKVLSTLNLERPEGTVMKEIDAAFMRQYPNIKLEYIDVPMADTAAKLVSLATAGDVPEVFTNVPQIIAANYDMGITSDLTPLLGKDYVNGFYESLLTEASIDGKLQLAPFFTIPTGLLYRKDIFDANGLTPPKTWEELVAAAAKLTKGGAYGIALMTSKGGSAYERFYNILRSYNADELRLVNGKFDTLVDNAGGIKSFSIFKELAQYAPPSHAQDAYAECVAHIANNKAYMMISGPHTIGAVLAQNPSLQGKLAGAPLPKGDRIVSTSGLYGFSISAQSKHKDAAVQYIKFILQPENAMKFMNVTGRIPTRKETGGSDSVANNATYRGFVEAIPYIIQAAPAPYWSKLGDPIATTYQAIILQNAPVERSVRDLGVQLRTIIRENQ
jgi:ABC-type glycerol-3-phosphate transport system substrate-binding protein